MRWLFALALVLGSLQAIELGVERFFSHPMSSKIKDKNIGLIINQTSVSRNFETTLDLFLKNNFRIKALFTPEHGLHGFHEAGQKVESTTFQSLPVFSLYGENRRPSEKMLKDIDVLIFDIQDIGVRSYTYASTLFYAMEEVAKAKKKLVVLDRPNPLGGIVVDGMMLDPALRSFVGYINVPYCHGMTIGELAQFFNDEYQIAVDLTVIPMQGWKRSMVFSETNLPWIPTSPHIPEPDTPFYYATTGLIGELGLASIGIGYTLPFKMIGAPWINADELASHLNAQKLNGVKFVPTHYKPFYGVFKGQVCHGVLIKITEPNQYKPASTQMLLLGILKSLYPKQFEEILKKVNKSAKDLFCKCSGTQEIFHILEKEKYASWKLIGFQNKEREAFLLKRKKFLNPAYD